MFVCLCVSISLHGCSSDGILRREIFILLAQSQIFLLDGKYLPKRGKEVLTRGFVCINQAPWYLAWAPPDPTKANLFSEIDTTRHAVQKRKYAAAYSMSSLVTYEPYVDNCSKMMVKRLSELAAKGTMVDLAWWLQCYAFDLIGEITYGKRFGLCKFAFWLCLIRKLSVCLVRKYEKIRKSSSGDVSRGTSSVNFFVIPTTRWANADHNAAVDEGVDKEGILAAIDAGESKV